MELRVVHDSNTAYEYLKNKTRYDYIYQFSNLTPEQWKNVVCYGLFDGEGVRKIAMVNTNYGIPVLLAANFDDTGNNIELMRRIKEFLPPKFYTHMDKVTLEEVFAKDKVTELENYMNMGLCNYDKIGKYDNNEVIRLGYKELEDIRELIEESYPEAWLDDELLKINENFGIYVDGRLVSFAGIHAYSEQYQVAAVAHVTTLPGYRKRGYAEMAIKELVKSLMTKISFIGLNVKVDNLPAINCYKKLGFEEFGRFVGCEIEQL